jgi:hypothetical protein
VHNKPAKNGVGSQATQLKLTPAKETKPAPISPTRELPAIAADIKSIVRKFLLASPLFPRLYADVLMAYAPNSNEAKMLAANYQKIVDWTNRNTTNQITIDQNTINQETINQETIDQQTTNRNPMSTYPNVKACTHIKVNGIPCGCPALRGEQFCYFHQRVVRGVRTPPKSRLHPIAIIENEEAIQSSLMEVINALVRNTIDLKRAELILRALHIAVRNVRRVQFGVHKAEMVREVPNYPDPPKPAVPSVPEPPIELNVKPLTHLQTWAALTVNPAEPIPDPTERKPPARAGLPPEKRKAAIQKGG